MSEQLRLQARPLAPIIKRHAPCVHMELCNEYEMRVVFFQSELQTSRLHEVPTSFWPKHFISEVSELFYMKALEFLLAGDKLLPEIVLTADL